MGDKKVSFDNRRDLVQEVIDRCIEYDKEYYDALREFNKQFTIKNRKDYIKDKNGNS